jgi:hypothetical protein
MLVRNDSLGSVWVLISLNCYFLNAIVIIIITTAIFIVIVSVLRISTFCWPFPTSVVCQSLSVAIDFLFQLVLTLLIWGICLCVLSKWKVYFVAQNVDQN